MLDLNKKEQVNEKSTEDKSFTVPLGQGEKKITRVKTFSVPFALEVIKENISISSNGEKEIYYEKIINKAKKLYQQGNIAKAKKYYQQVISQGCNDHRVFSNYGAILRGLGKSKEAEISLYKAIEIKPDYFQAHLNLGSILKDLGRLHEAEISTRKAIAIDSNYAIGHSNLGSILKDLGKSEEAFNSYLKVIEINPSYPNIYYLISIFLGDSNLSLLNKSKLKNIFSQLLDKTNIPHNDLFKAFKILYEDQLVINQEKLDSDYRKIESYLYETPFINALKKILLTDIKFEKILTKIRRNMCHRISNNGENINQSDLELIIAIGEQCFLNEYVYSLTMEENTSINKIINRCIEGEINETNISILSCYFPLYKLLDQIPLLKSFHSSKQSFKELIKVQVSEPLKEIELSKNIKKLGAINDKISQKVKSQYEENPYPRWRYGSHQENQKISITMAVNNEIKPNSVIYDKEYKQLKVLIAGCGTGNQLLQAQRYKNAQITGIDLSLSSLSYAQRKINELEINNVQLIQMDILNVSLLKTKFDIIECSGVLHHMKEPTRGLDCLLDCIDKNGFLKLALYSRIAIKDVIAAAEYISSRNLEPNLENIHLFREEVFSGKYPGNKDFATYSRDFYSSSEVRDFFFHYQANYIYLSQLEEILKQRSLKFLGFLQSQPVKSLYKNHFPDDKTQTNLQNWGKFEKKHPHIFRGMYQFWVCKGE